MSKWVDVPVTIMKTYAVEIEDDEAAEDAITYAMEECMGGCDVEINHGDVIVSENDQQAEMIRRNADEVLSL